MKVARSHHLPMRIEELNAVACGGWKGVSNTFGSALWAVETLLESVRSGVAGVNIHTRTRGLNSLFAPRLTNGRWEASVNPEYYGLMLFAQAVPPGSRLLHTTGGRTKARIHLWAARLPDRRIRIILINEDTRKAAVKVVAPAARGVGSLERLSAPSTHATTGSRSGAMASAGPPPPDDSCVRLRSQSAASIAGRTLSASRRPAPRR